jgi:uncharacterized protein
MAQNMGTALAQDRKLEIDLDDEDGQLEKLLAYIKENSEVGHSFDIVVDPSDPELARKFYIDGDGAFRIREINLLANDRALKRDRRAGSMIALDRASVRSLDRDGRMRVSLAHISKANVCPYRGREIPGWQELGLEPERIYQLLRDPEELAKGAKTSNGVQLLRRHVPVNAEDHQPYDVVGCLGTEGAFDGTYVNNSLTIWTIDAIEGIDSGAKRELSAGYHYVPDMTPGEFGGIAYDGVMREIFFNHVTIVEDGRAGSDVIVGDSTEGLMKTTRLAALALGITSVAIAPVLAMDQKLELPKDLFRGIDSKNFPEQKKKIIAAVRTAANGKLRRGIAMDEATSGLAKLLGALESNKSTAVDEPADEEGVASVAAAAPIEALKEEAPPADKPAAFDVEAVKEVMRSKGIGDDVIAEIAAMFPQPATDEFPPTRDGDDDPLKKKQGKEEKMGTDTTVTKQAMDAAIQTAVHAAEHRVIKREQGIRTALAEVKPWVGDLPSDLAFDSAEGVYRKACEMVGIEGADKLHADALLPVLRAQPKAGARAVDRGGDPRRIAMDSAGGVAKDLATLFPGIENIRAA